MHVLMVDDETEFLEIMKKRLGRRSMDITTASNGMDGLKCVQAMTDGTGPKFDVVVMDVRMPGMDGLETLGEMKKRRMDMTSFLLACGGASFSGSGRPRHGKWSVRLSAEACFPE